MSDAAGLTGEQIAWLQVAREIEEILAHGFYGQIVLTCQDGVVQYYDVNDRRKPGEIGRAHV